MIETSALAAHDGVTAERGHIYERLTWRWLARRSALWLALVTAMICVACGLYAVASDDGTTQSVKRRPPAVPVAYKTIKS